MFDRFKLEESEQEEEVPFRSRSGVGFGSVGWRAEFRSFENCKEQHNSQNTQTGNAIFQNLVRPERCIRTFLWFMNGQAVSPENVKVQRKKSDQQAW